MRALAQNDYEEEENCIALQPSVDNCNRRVGEAESPSRRRGGRGGGVMVDSRRGWGGGEDSVTVRDRQHGRKREGWEWEGVGGRGGGGKWRGGGERGEGEVRGGGEWEGNNVP